MTPVEPGFYYYRHPKASRSHIWIAEVVNTKASGLFATVFASIARDRVEHRPVAELEGQWFGPLPTPEEMGA
jgi:hypothetical protein